MTPTEQVVNPIKSEDELESVELNTEQCAKVALYMYEQWQEAMKPPLFIYKQFPDWLNQLTTNQEGES